MRLLLKSLAACTGAAAVIAIAGCGPASITDARQAANASGVSAASGSTAPATVGASQAAGAGAASSPAAGQASTSTAGSSQIAAALSIVMTVPVHHPAQTTAVIAGRLSQPGNGGAPLPGRVVWLQRLGAGGWLLFRRAVTGPDGRVAFQVHVVVGAAFRLVYAGTPVVARAVSAVRIVTA